MVTILGHNTLKRRAYQEEMMFKPVKTLAAIALIGAASLWSAAASAGPFEDGSLAYKRGDYNRAMALWQPLGGANAEVQNNIGIMYLDGKGVQRNNTEALRWIARSAANGSSSGQNNLGGLYRDGKGVTRDFAKAFAFFAASAAQGNAGGQLNLGLMYGMGQGTRVDNIRAFMWFDIAAAQGLQKAASNREIARQHLTNADFNAAVAMERRCRQSNFKACN
jgi:TPR repeat protein